MLNSALLIAQGLLAAVFALTGGAKLLLPKLTLQKQMHWAASWPPWRIKLLGLVEALGALGLVVPGATGIAQALTPVAALCLAVLMAGAIATHRRLGERVLPAVMVGTLCLLVAVGRSPLLRSTVLPAATAGPSIAPAVFSPLQDVGTPPRAPDRGTTRADQPRAGISSVQPSRGGVVQVSAVDDAPEPSPVISVKARTESTGGQPDPYMEALLEQSRAQSEALLEQSRAQTEALQQIATQQQGPRRRASPSGTRRPSGPGNSMGRASGSMGLSSRSRPWVTGTQIPSTPRAPPCGRPPLRRWRQVLLSRPPARRRPLALSRRRTRRSPKGTHSWRSTTSLWPTNCSSERPTCATESARPDTGARATPALDGVVPAVPARSRAPGGTSDGVSTQRGLCLKVVSRPGVRERTGSHRDGPPEPARPGNPSPGISAD